MFGIGLISFLPILIFLFLIYFFMEKSTTKDRILILKNLYLYLVSFVTLMMIIISSYSLIDLGLKTWVFTEADNYYDYQKPVITEDGTEQNLTKEEIANQQTEVEARDKQSRKAQTQRDLSQYIAMLVVATPVFITHLMMIRKKEEQA